MADGLYLQAFHSHKAFDTVDIHCDFNNIYMLGRIS